MDQFIFRITFILFILLSGSIVSAQEPVFKAALSSEKVGLSDQIELTFTINANGSDFQPPSFNDFYVLGGPAQSSSMQFINGNMSQSLSYTYVLQGKSAGTFKIGSASIRSGGKILKSNPLNVTITSTKSNNNQAKAGKSEDQSAEASLSDKVFIKAVVNKTSVIQGEPITVTYKLFSKVDLVDFNVKKMPTLNGFWSQDDGPIKRIDLKRETLNGVDYITSEIKKTVLFAQRSGNLSLDPMEAESIVRVRTKRRSRGHDPFEDFFNDPFFGGGVQDVKMILKSEPVNIKVNPLPSNAPESFSGAVGSFSMESFIDKPETKANEPVTLKIKIAGEGNIMLIDPIKMVLPPDIETYDPKVSQNIKTTNSGISGSKTFEYLLLPRHMGEYKLKPFEFSYYSIAKKKYITITSPEFNLKVKKGDLSETASSSSGMSKEDLKIIGSDIRFIKTNANPEFTKKGDYFYKSTGFYVLLISPITFLFLALFYKKKQERTAADTGLKSRKAKKVAKKRLEQAKQYIESGNSEKVYEEILRSIWGYMADKFNIPAADLSRSKVEEKLLLAGKDEIVIKELNLVIEKCEYARYAPSVGSSEGKIVYNQALDVIEKLES